MWHLRYKTQRYHIAAFCRPIAISGQGTKCRRNIAENFNRLSIVCMSVTDYRRQTDGRATANSERGREFTFAKKSTSS